MNDKKIQVLLVGFLSVLFFFSFFQSAQAGFFDWFRENDSQEAATVVSSAKQHTLSVSKSGSGVVISDDGKINCGKQCKVSYPASSKIVLKAEAGDNYKFERWNGCDKVSDGKCQTTLNKSKMIVAKFVSKRASSSSLQKSSSLSFRRASSSKSSSSKQTQNYKTLTIKNVFYNKGKGVVKIGDKTCDVSQCVFEYDLNKKVELQAEAESGSVLSDWGHDCDYVFAPNNICSLMMDDNKTVVVHFEPYISAASSSKSSSSSSSSKSSSSVSKSSSSAISSVFSASSSSSAATTISMLIVLLNFQDSPSAPFSSEQAKSIIFDGQIQEFYQEQSYNKAKLDGTILGWHTLSRDGDPDGTCMYPTAGEVEIQNLIVNSGVNPANYRHLVLVYNHPCMGKSTGAGIQQLQINGVKYQLSQLGASAQSYLSSENFPFNWTNFDYMIAHELGHGLGSNHAELWECGVGVTFGGDSCKEVGYGNKFDLMGHGTNALHFNAVIKDFLNWFDSSSIITITSSGRYTLSPYEGNSGFRAAKIKVPGREEYPFYLEYRQPLGFDARLSDSDLVSNTQGLFVNLKSGVDKVVGVKTSEYISDLLDFSPQSGDSTGSADFNEVTLNGSQRFVVQESGITIGPIISADASGITFDVKLENMPCVRHLPEGFPLSWSIKSGETVSISGDIHSKDSFTCDSSDFEFSLVAPQGWSSKINGTNRFTLAPGASRRIGYTITAPSNIAKGSYPVEINITNLTNGASGKLTTISFIVS